jgi:hypothetical protein
MDRNIDLSELIVVEELVVEELVVVVEELVVVVEELVVVVEELVVVVKVVEVVELYLYTLTPSTTAATSFPGLSSRPHTEALGTRLYLILLSLLKSVKYSRQI